MLIHLVYVSYKSESCTETEIENILNICHKNNPLVGITGILLYSEKKFLQYIGNTERYIFCGAWRVVKIAFILGFPQLTKWTPSS
ncbi:MAG: BLUF domain-containing protein, partial [Thermoflexibacter sp.]|nr:BLUF domain-containing protein [Thermoflexibacter sp.]